MSTFKEIDINEYKKLSDNMQHTYAKTFNNIELLHSYEENVNNKNIDSIIKNQESLQKDKYIEKLSDKISNKFQILILIIIILYNIVIRKNMFF